jgi:hypothetical protein
VPHKDIAKRKEYFRNYVKGDLFKEKKKNRRRLQREFINAAKDGPCTDCGDRHEPWVMDFDHVRGVKKYDLNRLGKVTVSWKTIEDEIAKCELVCSNCHRKRTHNRSQGRVESTRRTPNPLGAGEVPAGPAN